MGNKQRFISLLLCVFFLFGGCVSYSEESNNIDTLMFGVNIKSDPMADFGRRTAYSDGRIYYLSDENGKQGLHSMAVNGSDVRLEFATEDIRSLTVRDDTIWTAEFVGMDENDCGEYRKFGLFVRRGSADALPEDVLAKIDAEIRRREIYWDENVLDLYVTENEDIFFYCAFVQMPQGYPSRRFLWLQRNGTLSSLETMEFSVKIAKTEDMKRLNTLYNRCIELEKLGPILLFRDYYRTYEIYDLAADRTGFETDGRYDLTYSLDREDSERKLIGVGKERLYFVGSQEVLALQPETLQSEQLMTLDGHEGIFAAYRMEKNLLLLSNTWKEEESLFDDEWVRSDKTLYRLDLETGEREQLLSIELPRDFVYLDENYAATAEGKTLTLYDIRGEEAREIRQIELDHEIVDKANKTDAAGGWWFLYRFNEETNRDELIEKVRLF